MGKGEASPLRRSRKKIVYVWNYRDWGGAQVYFASIIPEAKKHFDIVAAMPIGSDDQVIEKFRLLGADVQFLVDQTNVQKQSTLFGRLRQHYRKARAEHSLVKQIIENNDPAEALLHIDLGFWSSLLVLLRLSSRFQVFLTIHTPLNPKSTVRGFLWKLKGMIASRGDKLHFLSSNEPARQSLREYLPVRKHVDIKVAYSGIDINEIEQALKSKNSRQAIRDRIGVSDSDLLIVLVGQFIERKGASVLLDALPKIVRRESRAKFVWLTMREAEGDLARRAADRVTNFPFSILLGDNVGGRQGVMELQSSADLFLLPSLEEGLPIALIESMALGLPCIASDVGAVGEAIVDGVTGRLVTAGDVDELGDAVISLLADTNERRRLGSNAQKLAIEKFDNRIAAQTTVEEYLTH